MSIFKNEAEFEAAIADAFEAIGGIVRRQVSARLPTPGRISIEKIRLDLMVKMPTDWTCPFRGDKPFAKWPFIALEVKRDEATGSFIDGMWQAEAYMQAFDFKHEGAPLPRPSIALLVTERSWLTGQVDPLAERVLWRKGCSILRGPGHRMQFVSNTDGGKQYSVYLPRPTGALVGADR